VAIACAVPGGTAPAPRAREKIAYAIESDISLGFPVLRALSGCRTILDVGCGSQRWSWNRLLGKERLHKGVGLDAYRPAFSPVAGCPRYGSYVLGVGTQLPFLNESCDAVIALDVIEHLPKAQGLKAISEMKRVARRLVLVVTPNGFLPQSASENPFQEHISGWDYSELRELGFRVSGIRGLRVLRGPYARPSFRPMLFGTVIAIASVPLARLRPSAAFQLLGVWARGEPTEAAPSFSGAGRG
jgi:SAM-dependent methyltransferase